MVGHSRLPSPQIGRLKTATAKITGISWHIQEPNGVLDVMGPLEPLGEGSVFDLKRDLVLLLAALAG